VLINTLLTSDQYHYLLEDTRAKVAFVSPSILPIVLSAAAGVATLKHVVVVGEHSDKLQRFDVLLATQREQVPAAKTCADEVAYWLYSSGTTGMPKGVLHVHSSLNFISQLAGQSRLGFREDDRVFSTAKLFFAYGIGTSI
jgi:4-hydroxybenzoate-CoA ligase